MQTAFFHQAHLNNWRVYSDALHGARRLPTWDDVVLTAANESQAAAFRYQLRVRHELGMLPKETAFHVVADPGGIRIGSGGATLNVLEQLTAQYGVPPDRGEGEGQAFFADRRILVLHSGGDSKRLPQYSAFGKVFAPIPRLLASGRPSTLFDELFVALSGLPGTIGPGLLLASGDVLLLFDHSQLSLVRPGMTGIAIRTDCETATHHGVFVPDASGRVQLFLHKPALRTLRKYGALSDGGHALVDTGIVYVDANTASALWLDGCAHGGWLHQAVESRTSVNLYGDILSPLAPGTAFESYINDTSDGPAVSALKAIRQSIWDSLRGTPFYVETLHPAKFLHFGTVREYQRLITYDDDDVRALGGKRRVSHVLGEDSRVAETACILHSEVGAQCVIEAGTTVEFSDISRRCTIGKDSVVSNMKLPEDAVVPSNVVVHSLPLASENADNGPTYVVRIWGVDDNPKDGLATATFLGEPMRQWLTRCGISRGDLWPDARTDAECKLWDANLFPVCSSIQEAWEACLWLFKAGKSGSENDGLNRWRHSARCSLHSSYERADLDVLGSSWESLFSELVFHKCRHFFESEHPVARWIDKIPTNKDLGNLIARMSDDKNARYESLDKARWHYSIAVLARMGRESERFRKLSRRHEDRAFREVARVMVAAQNEHAAIAAVTDWKQAAVAVQLPARIDFAGGWSDTPPHALERGGTVLNAAVCLDGEFPVTVEARRLDDPIVRLESQDLGFSTDCCSLDDLQNFANPKDPLALHKAAFCFLVMPKGERASSLQELCKTLGGGLHLASRVSLPKGSGLGTSSILAAGLAKGLLLLGAGNGVTPGYKELFDAAAVIEQMLTTGGGWQDQVGGLVPGLKLSTSGPGAYQELSVKSLNLNAELRRELDRRLIVIDTGQRRLAKNLLRQVMGKWLARETRTVEILSDIQRVAKDMACAIERGDFRTAGERMWWHWELNKELDENTSNEFIDGLMDSIAPYLEGAKLAGAGGGGYLLGIVKDGAQSSLQTAVDSEYGDANVRIHESRIVWEL
ncbi:MAG: hypothetical protein K9N51_00265 [Candidatus Pacebacteria bacterium]|nr:hypothetical protein [Candidatus Paceibacterota bacterium]